MPAYRPDSSALANNQAITAAEAFQGNTMAAVDPPGGQIIRMADGVTPSGALLDDAMSFVRSAIPPLTQVCPRQPSAEGGLS